MCFGRAQRTLYYIRFSIRCVLFSQHYFVKFWIEPDGSRILGRVEWKRPARGTDAFPSKEARTRTMMLPSGVCQQRGLIGAGMTCRCKFQRRAPEGVPMASAVVYQILEALLTAFNNRRGAKCDFFTDDFLCARVARGIHRRPSQSW
jgi:hypothetical protein